MEVETFLGATVRLGYLTQDKITTAWELCQEVARLLNGLLRALDKPSGNNRISEEAEDYTTNHQPPTTGA